MSIDSVSNKPSLSGKSRVVSVGGVVIAGVGSLGVGVVI